VTQNNTRFNILSTNTNCSNGTDTAFHRRYSCFTSEMD